MAFRFSATLVRQGASANGPAWAAPRITGTPTKRFAARPFCQGPDKHVSTSGENACMRVNDSLKGMLGNSRALGRKQMLSPLVDL